MLKNVYTIINIKFDNEDHVSQYLTLHVFLTQFHTCKARSLPLAQAVDPCDLPKYCKEGTRIPNPDNCESYLECSNAFMWEPRQCPDTTCFDVNELRCVLAPCECFPACPVYTGPTTEGFTREILTPGLCYDVEPCKEGEKFTDVSDCEFYFQCIGGTPIRLLCAPGLVFDVFKLDCEQPSNDFNCDYRCITTAPTTSTVAMTTESSTQESTTTELPSSSEQNLTETSTVASTRSPQEITSAALPTTSSSSSSPRSTDLLPSPTTPNGDVTHGPPKDDSSMLLAIIIPAVCGVAIIIVIVAACVCCKKNQVSSDGDQYSQDEVKKGDLGKAEDDYHVDDSDKATLLEPRNLPNKLPAISASTAQSSIPSSEDELGVMKWNRLPNIPTENAGVTKPNGWARLPDIPKSHSALPPIQ
ncbi:hypothetical protein CAPTEDRAFT_196974 [Capitella teleta]|uniref:Chitin-binding type-2 domain-containing protein n=1 Tax=Capitella teleta TaxID=283909 RepID=R7TB95_CAPTE|nr:hypothetical protein CAPTEDRAFT_196974 [Capitella teleta]|eukprot:ELT90984.1 hypothetical protein CAPTEDRAFT_196974 [Capitella teleta]